MDSPLFPEEKSWRINKGNCVHTQTNFPIVLIGLSWNKTGITWYLFQAKRLKCGSFNPNCCCMPFPSISGCGRQRCRGILWACPYSPHLCLGTADSRNFHQGSLASRWSLHITPAIHGKSEKSEEGLEAFSLCFYKGKTCQMGTEAFGHSANVPAQWALAWDIPTNL